MQRVHEVLLARHQLLIELVRLRVGVASRVGIAGDEVAGDFPEAERLASSASQDGASRSAGRCQRRAPGA